MMRMDPFFKAKEQRFGKVMQMRGLPPVKNYVQDIAETYNYNPLTNGPMPQKSGATYERALKFREEEKEHHSRLRQEIGDMREVNRRNIDLNRELLRKIQDSHDTQERMQQEFDDKYSKLKQEHERTVADWHSRGSNPGREHGEEQTPSIEAVAEAEAVVGAPSDAGPTDVGGPAREDGDA